MRTDERLQVRPATEMDHEALTDMWIAFLEEQTRLDDRFIVADDARERWRNDLPEWIRSHVHGMFVAEDAGGEPVGFATVHLWYPAPIYRPDLEAYVNEIYVREDRRRRGIARALLNSVREWAQAHYATRIRLGVLTANEDGRAFWAAVGARDFVSTMLIDA